MDKKSINSDSAPAPLGGYEQAIEVSGTTRRLYISGQIPMCHLGAVPETFQAQAELVWDNIKAQLREASMTLNNLVKVTIYLSDRKHCMENRAVRERVMVGQSIASTVIIADIFSEEWLLEIEGIAEA